MRGLEALNQRQRDCVQTLNHEGAPEYEVSALPPASLTTPASKESSAIDGIIVTHPKWHGLTLQVLITSNVYVTSRRYEMPPGASVLTGAAEERAADALRAQGQLWLSREHNAKLLVPIPFSEMTALVIPLSSDNGDHACAVSELKWLGDERRMSVFFLGEGHFMILTIVDGALVEVAVSSSLGLPSAGSALIYWPRHDIERLAEAYCGPRPSALAKFTQLCAEREIGLTRGEGSLVHVSDSPRDPYRGGTTASETIDLSTGEVSDQMHYHLAPMPDDEPR